MASKHDSKNSGTGISSGQKRPITYGKSPRRRHPSDTTRILESSPASWQALKSTDDATASVPSRPTPTSKKRDRPTTPHSQRNALQPPGLKQGGTPIDETARKRKRSAAFAPASASAAETQARNHDTESAAVSFSSLNSRLPIQDTSVVKTAGTRLAPTAKTGKDTPSISISILPPAARTIGGGLGRTQAHDRLSTKRGLDHTDSPRPRRPRLIDTLAAQRADSPDPDLDPTPVPASDPDPDLDRPERSYSPSIADEFRTPLSQGSVSAVGRDARSRPTDRLGDSSKGRKIKFTYSQARTIRNEPSKLDELGTGDIGKEDDSFLSESLLPDPLGLSDPLAFAFPDDDDEHDAQRKVGIKSVHELRRAGANHRFADEMEDLLSRIGTPSRAAPTMRRNALLELAQKLRREDFSSQFRDHATRDNIAKGIGIEEDVISGFALAAVLVIFLSSGPAPHLLRQLADDEVGKLLARLMRLQEDIDELALQKRTNLPKISRTSLNSVKNQVLQLRIWHGYDPVSLSPRTVALQLLDIITQWSDVDYLEKVMRDLTQDLAEVANGYASEGSDADADFALIARVFETQSSVSTALDGEAVQTSQRSAIVAKFLQGTLQRWPDNRGELESRILRLAINTTNTARGAEAFDDQRLLSSLTDNICRGFGSVQEAVTSRNLQDGIYDELTLILGVMINVLEHCGRARYSVDEASLEKLVVLYLGNHKSMTEADSMDTSKLSVASGYLAVLLGYLSLAAPVQMKMEQAPGGEDHSLVESIQKFIAIYKNVDSKVHELEGLVEELRGHRYR